MKNKFLYFLMMIGLAVTLTACGSGDDGATGADGADGAAGVDATTLPPDDTYFSIVITENGHWHIGDNIVYADFVANGGTAATAATGTTNDWVTANHIDDMSGNLVLDGDNSDWPAANLTTVKAVGWVGSYNDAGYSLLDRDITVGIAYDDAYIYMVASWPDTTQTYDGRARYEYDGANWTQSSNALKADEDRLFVFWPITDAESNYVAGGGGCLNYCHVSPKNGGEHMAANTAGDRVDIWHWKSVRNDPIGFLEDKHMIVAGYEATTPFAPTNGRKADGGRGPNTSISLVGGVPELVNYKWPSSTYSALLEFDAVTYVSAEDAGYTAASGDVTPRYMNRQPNGSIADVEIVSSYDPTGGLAGTGEWTVEMRRLRLTGDPGDDRQFTGGGTDATAPTAAADVAIATASAAGAPSACIACHPLDGSGANPNLQNQSAGWLYAAPGNASGDSGTMTSQTAITAKQAVDFALALKQ